MAKDEETGVDPKAKDGFTDGPDGDEVARRRAQKDAEEKKAAAAAKKKPGGSAKDRAAQQALDGDEPETGETDDGQLFVWEQGTKVTLGSLISRSVPVEHVFVFGGKRTKGRGGLMSLDEQPVLVVRGMSGGVKVVPTHNDDGKVTKVVIEQHVLSQLVCPADSDEGEAMVAPILADRKARQAS